MLTQARLKELLHYDPDTGIFTWLGPRARGIAAGSRAGSVTGTFGYDQICIEGVAYYGHRLAFLYMTGEWPREQVDHINGVTGDNRWRNLRNATRNINQQNLKKAKIHNMQGLLGVHKNRRRFSAKIQAFSKRYHLGTYDTPEEAHQVYLTAKRKLHPGCTI